MFKKVLIANRGEIASRLVTACQELGVRSVTVYSDADAKSPWVRRSHERYPLHGVAAIDTYLDQEKILAIATACGAEAIHPGYGFLSENPAFAAACVERGLAFIGPSAQTIALMGSKAEARKVAQAAGVPTIPGIDGAGMDQAALAQAAVEIGYPVLIKASAGGGGKGMRVVRNADDLAGGLQAARRESLSAFGSDHILLEKYFVRVHHVEIQVLGDQQGNLLHLYERECSIQRRHQKIIEESPAPAIRDKRLREEMAAAAVTLARAADYVGAGTVEFLLDEHGEFYFLEMNTRLQVEHPVTEFVTGIDLASWQIRIAAGESVPFSQDEIRQSGHAIECRVYAEDAGAGFLPAVGTIVSYRRPEGPGVRVDDGVEAGTEITPYYDPMLAKVITWGHDRPSARQKMLRALRELVVLGLKTNVPYLQAILQEPHFVAGETPTDFLDVHMNTWEEEGVPEALGWLAAPAFEFLSRRRATDSAGEAQPPTAGGNADPWHTIRAWRNVLLPGDQ